MRTLIAAAAAVAALFATPLLAQQAETPAAPLVEHADPAMTGFIAEAQAFAVMTRALVDQAAPIRADAALTQAQREEKVDALMATKETEIAGFVGKVTALAREKMAEAGLPAEEIDAELAGVDAEVRGDVRQALLTGEME